MTVPASRRRNGYWFLSEEKVQQLPDIVEALNAQLLGQRLLHTEFDTADSRALLKTSYTQLVSSRPVRVGSLIGAGKQQFITILTGSAVNLPIKRLVVGEVAWHAVIEITGNMVILRQPYFFGEDQDVVHCHHHSYTRLGPIVK